MSDVSTIECGECRNDIRHGGEYYCGVSLCENCLLHHEDGCGLSIEMVKGDIFEFDCVKNWWVEALLQASIVHFCPDFTIQVRLR